MWMQRNLKLNATDFDGFKKEKKKTIKNEKAADNLMAQNLYHIPFLDYLNSGNSHLIQKKMKSHYLELRVNNLVEFSVTILP